MARSVSGGSSATHIDRSRCPQEGGELRTPELTASLLRNGERKLVGRPRTFSDNGRTYLTKRADTHVLSIVSMVHIARPRRPPSLDFPRESAGVISIRRPVTVDARVDSSHDLVLKPLEITSPQVAEPYASRPDHPKPETQREEKSTQESHSQSSKVPKQQEGQSNTPGNSQAGRRLSFIPMRHEQQEVARINAVALQQN
mmetsp:Transcript_22788/g.44447  ORF Transcript_22788/g.44447 Transcript_22788/m.44447 type:complete len:200 (+) Transcript_22788:1095-1694(+)